MNENYNSLEKEINLENISNANNNAINNDKIN